MAYLSRALLPISSTPRDIGIGMYPLVISYIAIEHLPMENMEIVDLSIKNGDFP